LVAGVVLIQIILRKNLMAIVAKADTNFCSYYVLDLKKHKYAFDELKSLSRNLDADIKDQ